MLVKIAPPWYRGRPCNRPVPRPPLRTVSQSARGGRAAGRPGMMAELLGWQQPRQQPATNAPSSRRSSANSRSPFAFSYKGFPAAGGRRRTHDRRPQEPLGATPCGFESHRRHHMLL